MKDLKKDKLVICSMNGEIFRLISPIEKNSNHSLAGFGWIVQPIMYDCGASLPNSLIIPAKFVMTLNGYNKEVELLDFEFATVKSYNKLWDEVVTTVCRFKCLQEINVFGRTELQEIWVDYELIKDDIQNLIKPHNTFTKDEIVVWDSNFGYDIGKFIGDAPSDDNYSIELLTSSSLGIDDVGSFSKSQIRKYSEDLIEELTKKYGYEKRFY